MNSAFNKEIIRSIRSSLGRFLAIAIICFLGAGFYAGLRMSAPDMRIAGDEFFDATSFYDVSVVSSLGLDDASVEMLQEVPGVQQVMPAYRSDAMLGFNGKTFAADIESLPKAAWKSDTADGVHAYSQDDSYLNRPLLVAGEWPSSANECVIGSECANSLQISLGDTLSIKRIDGSIDDVFAVREFTVSGFVNSSAFIADSVLGTSTLGSGKVEAYLFVSPEAFAEDFPYSTALLTVQGAFDATWDNDDYDEIVSETVEQIQTIAPTIALERDEAIRNKAQQKLDDARQDYLEERRAAEEKLADARTQLENAQSQLQNAESKLVDARAQLENARIQLASSKEELDAGEAEYQKGLAEYEAGVAQLQPGVDTLPALMQQLEALKLMPDASPEQKAALQAQIEEIQAGQAGLEQAKAKLDGARAELDNGWAQYNAGKAAYESGVSDYESGRASLENGKADYASGKQEYDDNYQKAQDGFADAEAELADAQRDIDELDKAEVFVLGRDKNPGAASLSHDAESITQIATYLPFVFILVAALVVLTSMTRMVDEERLDIGTHKALGYSKASITGRYLIYGALASGIGSFVGVFVLGKILPWFIMTSYAINYSIPVVPLPIDPVVAAKAVGITMGVALLATWAAAMASLRETPAALMLPKVPRAGKRILLERVGPLWRRFTFSHKITARNLLRYKRRFFMAVVGIAGCTALLMIGFGLRDAIGDIVTNQYDELITYDAAIKLEATDEENADDVAGSGDSDSADAADVTDATDAAGSDDASVPEAETDMPRDYTLEEARRVAERAFSQDSVVSTLFVSDIDMIAAGSGDDLRINMVVPSNVQMLPDYITLRERENGESISLDSHSLVLTEKAAKELGVGIGDTVTLYDENMVGDKKGTGHEFVLGAITENYLQHYAYVSPEAYRQVMGEDPEFDVAFVNFAEDADVDALASEFTELDAIATVEVISDRIVQYEDMLDVMNKLILVVVLLAAALAFVVLYNLTNINISERVREIATLKVLGFMRGEVDAYIFREVFIMVIIGALLGCVLGVPLTIYIAEAAETATMMFGRSIAPMSFVASFLITVAFTFIVMLAMRPKLARVNMVESLKSIE